MTTASRLSDRDLCIAMLMMLNSKVVYDGMSEWEVEFAGGCARAFAKYGGLRPKQRKAAKNIVSEALTLLQMLRAADRPGAPGVLP